MIVIKFVTEEEAHFKLKRSKGKHETILFEQNLDDT